MEPNRKLILAKAPIVLICFVLLFVDFSSGDSEPQDKVTRFFYLGLHLLVLLVFVDLALKSQRFSNRLFSHVSVTLLVCDLDGVAGSAG
jgi:hypothetical protein